MRVPRKLHILRWRKMLDVQTQIRTSTESIFGAHNFQGQPFPLSSSAAPGALKATRQSEEEEPRFAVTVPPLPPRRPSMMWRNSNVSRMVYPTRLADTQTGRAGTGAGI
ncbi:uncharacterized protein ACBT44_000341 isoform 1-T1 [Syngnathus typhle]